MTLRDLVAWVVGVLPAKYSVLYVNYLLRTLRDSGRLLTTGSYFDWELGDREIGDPSRVVVMSDQEIVYESTRKCHNPELYYDEMVKIDIGWGDGIDDWIKDYIGLALWRGFEHLYLFCSESGHFNYRNYIYINLKGYEESDWDSLKNTLKAWEKSRYWLQYWEGKREEWLHVTKKGEDWY